MRPQDFKRVLETPVCLRSAHFAVHHLAQAPSRVKWPRNSPDKPQLSTELSTDADRLDALSVDDARRWLGLVVPKRQARRAATRTLVKRQIRCTAVDFGASLSPGLWVVRQRLPFDTKEFPSAASDALKTAVRTELRGLFERLGRGERESSSGRRSPRRAAS